MLSCVPANRPDERRPGGRQGRSGAGGHPGQPHRRQGATKQAQGVAPAALGQAGHGRRKPFQADPQVGGVGRHSSSGRPKRLGDGADRRGGVLALPVR